MCFVAGVDQVWDNFNVATYTPPDSVSPASDRAPACEALAPQQPPVLPAAVEGGAAVPSKSQELGSSLSARVLGKRETLKHAFTPFNTVGHFVTDELKRGLTFNQVQSHQGAASVTVQGKPGAMLLQLLAGAADTLVYRSAQAELE